MSAMDPYDDLRRRMRRAYVSGDLGALEAVYAEFRRFQGMHDTSLEYYRNVCRREIEIAIEKIEWRRKAIWKKVVILAWKRLTRR